MYPFAREGKRQNRDGFFVCGTIKHNTSSGFFFSMQKKYPFLLHISLLCFSRTTLVLLKFSLTNDHPCLKPFYSAQNAFPMIFHHFTWKSLQKGPTFVIRRAHLSLSISGHYLIYLHISCQANNKLLINISCMNK